MVQILEYYVMKKHLLTTASALTLLLATQASANEINIVQSGTDNKLSTTQTAGQAGLISIDQTGGGSVAEVKQVDTFAAGGATANSADIDQDGIAQAVVVQNAGADGILNTAIINQFSNAISIDPPDEVTDDTILFNVDADINQTGSSGIASIIQGTALLSVSAARADVTQDGLNNKAYVEQYGASSIASVNQSSEGNLSRTTQSGDGSIANVSQAGGSAGGSNESFITQELASFGSSADVIQSGDNALSNITQGGTDNYARVNQGGDGSESNVWQFGSSGEVEVDQIGNSNTSNVTQQSTTGGSVRAVVDQSGSDNTSTIFQGKVPNGNLITTGSVNVTQSGIGGKSTVTQWRNGGSTVILDQSGSLNISEIEQEDATSRATVTQKGTSGKSVINQISVLDGGGNRISVFNNQATVSTNASAINTLSTINQNGYYSVANVTQNNGGSVGITPSVRSTITQSGTATATVLQSSFGSNNEVIINQFNGNTDLRSTATVEQTVGSDQFAAVYQIGSNHVASIYQSGTANQATIYQNITTAAYASITQSGNGNVATVNQ